MQQRITRIITCSNCLDALLLWFSVKQREGRLIGVRINLILMTVRLTEMACGLRMLLRPTTFKQSNNRTIEQSNNQTIELFGLLLIGYLSLRNHECSLKVLLSIHYSLFITYYLLLTQTADGVYVNKSV
jgi:hypothetical protein